MTAPRVLVVGAGPAGCIAALVLARAGIRVRLIDRARFPRDKLCGDTLNPGSLAILDRLGLGGEVRRRALAVRGMIVTGPGGVRVVADYPAALPGAALCRCDLDLLLLTAAADAGVSVDAGLRAREPLGRAREGRVTGVRVTGAGGDEMLSGDIVIGADGHRSRLASALGLSRPAPSPRRWAFGAYFTGIEGMTAYGEMHIRAGGYVGLAPLPGGAINVCVVREIPRDPPGALAGATRVIPEAIGADPGLLARFAYARQVSGVTTLGPLAVDSREAGCPGLLLAGDAAGFVDPMTGDGLRFALRGGELAAAAALRELESGQPAFRGLTRARSAEFAGKWRLNRTLRSLVGSRRAVELAAAMARAWPGPVRYLIGMAGDISLARAIATTDTNTPHPLR